MHGSLRRYCTNVHRQRLLNLYLLTSILTATVAHCAHLPPVLLSRPRDTNRSLTAASVPCDTSEAPCLANLDPSMTQQDTAHLSKAQAAAFYPGVSQSPTATPRSRLCGIVARLYGSNPLRALYTRGFIRKDWVQFGPEPHGVLAAAGNQRASDLVYCSPIFKTADSRSRNR